MSHLNILQKKWVSLYFIRDDTFVKVLEDDIKHNNEDEWFIPLLVKYDTRKYKSVDITEDKRTVMMMIESIRHSKLILYQDIELEYLKVLSDKWCMPDWFKEELNIKIEELATYKSNIDTQFQEFLEDQLLECKKCNLGFKLKENTSESCNTHMDDYCNVGHRMKCCGAANYHSSYCRVGLHVADTKTILIYKELYDSLKLKTF